MSTLNQRLLLALKVSIGVGLLVFLVIKAHPEKLVEVASSANVQAIAIGFLMFLLTDFLDSWRLKSAFSSYHLSYRESLKIHFIRKFFASIMPGNLGAEAYKAWYFHTVHKQVAKPAAVMVVLRATSFMVIGVAAAIYVLLAEERVIVAVSTIYQAARIESGTATVIVILLGIGMMLGLLLYLFSRRSVAIDSSLGKLAEAFREIGWPMVTWLSFQGLIVNTARAAGMYYLTISVAPGFHFGDTIVLMATAVFATALPISIAGLGVREGVYAATLVGFGVGSAPAVVSAFLARITVTLIAAAGGVIFLLTRHTVPNLENQQTGDDSCG